MDHTQPNPRTSGSSARALERHHVGGKSAWRRLLMVWMPLALGLMLALVQFSARAQDDPPGRVGRLANLQGEVSWFDIEEGQWAAAERNRPLTLGDRVSTGPGGRAELRVGSSVLRLAPLSEVEVLRLDDSRMVWQLHSGAVALRLRTREAALETEVVTREARLLPDRAGHYRLDRIDDTTLAAAWTGSLRVQGAPEANSAYFVIDAGQRLEMWREGNRYSNADTLGPLRQRASRLPDDEFSAWVLAEDRQDDRSTAYRYVSPEMTGAEDLDRYGRWEQHPEYGAMWFPSVVAADWAPYRHGRWAWVQPWGWTWVDEARWGFAPFHYGRWLNWRGRWAWSPGSYVARPVFAPALVAWVGGPRLGVSVSIGLPAVAWVPLAPREVFVPHYRHSPVYVDRVNEPRARRPGAQPDRGPRPAPMGAVVYGNQGVPGAVTVVPRDVLLQRQPVARAVVVDGHGAGPASPRRPDAGAWEAAAPPLPERVPQRRAPVVTQPGRDERGAWGERNDRNDRPAQQRPEWRDAVNPPQPAPHGQGPMAPAAPTAPVLVPRSVPAQAPTEPAPAPRVDNPRRDRDAPRQGAEKPAWNMGPQRPNAPAPAPAPAPTQAPAAAPVATPATAPQAVPAAQVPAAPRAQPPRAPAAPDAAPQPSRQPTRLQAPAPAAAAPVAAAAAPAAKPAPQAPAAQAGPERPRDVKPERGADAEEGRKRGPDVRNRDREAVR